ncbi:MAG: ABC transporter permease [Candidatus Bathyarchaeota archaeon]|nr:ABC transporter permease [Candidatus Bathyarchaeota archaeon]
MFSYALKRVARSPGLFAALLLGVVLASTFFAGINIGADTTAKAALNQQLSRVLVDITASKWYDSQLTSANWTTAAEKVTLVNDVIHSEVISRADWHTETDEKNFTFCEIAGILDASRVHSGLQMTSGASSLQENEAYVWIGSPDADKLEVNDVLTFNFTFWTYAQVEKNVSLQLKVAGFVDLDETAYALVSGQYWSGDGQIIYVNPTREPPGLIYYRNLLIVSWERTFAKLLDTIYTLNPSYNPFYTEILVFLNREAVINPWDIGASQGTINRIILQIDNEVAKFGLEVSNNLQSALSVYQALSIGMRLSFLVVALPVFFVAWYVGTTVSEVSFNLRRREIGLLLAKGFSSGQLFRLFLSESLLIGVLGSLVGIGLSFLFSSYFVTVIGGNFGGVSPVLTTEIVILAIIFGTGMTLLSTFRPSRRAAKLSTVDALQEYMYVEETKPYKQRWPWAALFLGTYKIGMILLGMPSVMQFFMWGPPPTTNIFLVILLAAWMIIDSILTPIGPLLFFWGFTKIFVRGSVGFQRLVTRTAKFLGDLGTLATKNMRRNPARAASVAFLIAMIIGYGFQTVGVLASEEDYVIRQVKANVGADVSVSLTTLVNATAVMEEIAKLPEVASVTLEYSFHGETSFQSLSLVAVNPQEWLSTAYYENEWFTGNDVANAFQQITADNNTIILERTMANILDLGIGDFITLDIGYATIELKVVGFLGPEVGRGGQPVFRPGESYSSSLFWSYVSTNLYHTLDGTVFASGKVLVKLEPNANGTSMANQIRALNLDDIGYVDSVAERLEQRETNLLLSGTTNIQRIGVIFAVAAASIATALVALVSLQERKKEVTIMNVRGFSFKQLITMLLAENLAIVIFATTLGVVVGLIIVYGSIVALNTSPFPTLVTHRMVFSSDAILILSISLVLVFASSILPIVAITKRYVSKLERIVRA